MGRGRETCSQACAKKRQANYKARTKAGSGNTRSARRTIVNRCCRKLEERKGTTLTSSKF